MTFYIFHRNKVCLVNRVDLICSLFSWWESFGSSSLTTLPQGFDCVEVVLLLGSQGFWQYQVLRGVGG